MKWLNIRLSHKFFCFVLLFTNFFAQYNAQETFKIEGYRMKLLYEPKKRKCCLWGPVGNVIVKRTLNFKIEAMTEAYTLVLVRQSSASWNFLLTNGIWREWWWFSPQFTWHGGCYPWRSELLQLRNVASQNIL